MKRVLFLPTVILLLMGTFCYLLTGGTAASTKNSQQRPIVFCSADEIRTLDVGKMSWQSDIRTAMGLWEGLAAYDPVTLERRPAVAESWDISPDKKTYTFHLRNSARWSNGTPVTAGDFVFAWRRVLTPATGAQYGELLNCIAGVKAYSDAIAAHEKTPTALVPSFSTVGISAPDPHTLIVNLESPTSYFLDLVAFPTFYPLYEPAMVPFQMSPTDPEKGYDGRWTRPPALVSNGPFRLTEWKVRDHMTLEPNENYWDRAAVKCDRLILKSIPRDERAAFLAYKTGAVDALSFVPQEFGEELMEAQKHGQWLDVHYRPVFGSYYFVINCTRPPLNDKKVRKALALAINRQELVDEVTRMHQKTMGVLVPPGSIANYTSPPGLTGDIDEARRLMAEAGFPDGKGFRSLEILYSTDVSVHGRVAQAISQMWKQTLGITVTLRGLEKGGFSAARQTDHDFDVARGGWYGDYPDPTTWLDLCRSANGNNDSQFASPAFDALMDSAAREVDVTRRMAILSGAEQSLVNDELPLIPLYQYGDGYTYDEKKILGLDVNVRLLTQFKYIHRAP